MENTINRKPIVALIGRQNVGKSTLLNRLAGKRIAIVEDLPGTTRDRVFTDIEWDDKEFTLVDTGGLELDSENELSRGVMQQLKIAVEQSDMVLFLTDAKEGLISADFDIADLLRRTEKPVVLVVNKTDNDLMESQISEFFELGLGDPFPISAFHARGTGELLDKITTLLPEYEKVPDDPELMKLAIVGRPNVGKSMLINRLFGADRSVVSNVPGTTRDAVDTILEFKGKKLAVIDTAGIRKRGSVDAGIEKYSVLRSFRAIERADVALLVLDATEPLTTQDTHIAGYVQQAYKGIIIVVNKWDLIKDKDTAAYMQVFQHHFNFINYATVLFVSALTGDGAGKIIPEALKVFAERNKMLTDAEIRSVIQQALATHPPPKKGRKILSIRNSRQTGVNPPTFTFKVNDERLLHFSYKRYLENQIRSVFGFLGTPISMNFSTGGGKK